MEGWVNTGHSLCLTDIFFWFKNKFVSPSLLANGFEGMMHIVTFFILNG